MTTTKAGRPTRGAAHNEYFSAINALLKEQGPGHPVMVLDLDILDQNIRILKQKMPPPKSFRVVVKSLPSVELLRHVFDMAGTARAMLFHRPFLNRIAREFPNVDVLLGKPLPVRAARSSTAGRFSLRDHHSDDCDPAGCMGHRARGRGSTEIGGGRVVGEPV